MNEQTDDPRDHATDGIEETVLRETPYEPLDEDPYGSAPDHDLAAAAAGASDGGTVEKDSGFHPVHVAHLVMGIAFLAFAGIWAALTSDVVDGEDLRWLLPVPWLLAGTVGLLASVAGRRARLERKRERRAYRGA